MSKESTKTAAAVADKVAHSVDYMEQYTADLVAAVRKGAGGVGELLKSRLQFRTATLLLEVSLWFNHTKETYFHLVIFYYAERPLEGFHIVVDAGNGAGGFFAVRKPVNQI